MTQPLTDEQLIDWEAQLIQDGGWGYAWTPIAASRLIAEVRRLRGHVENQGMAVVDKEELHALESCWKNSHALEAQLVTMRGALEKIEHGWAEDDQSKFCNDMQNIVMVALTFTADYADKVVVDRETLYFVWRRMELAIQAYPALDFCSGFSESMSRLDAIRKGGKG